MTAFLGTTLIRSSPERSAVLSMTLPVCNLLVLLLLLSLLLLLLMSLLLLLQSHHLCRPQRHCSRAARLGVPTSGNTQDSFLISRGPARRGPQEVTSGRLWAVIRRRHSTSAESLGWCSLMPVLIQHTQGNTCYAPHCRQC